ncbi:MAG: UDP-N-acetylmuramate dehydrogenase [Clostridia bacterium]|nr:UDP-N-acetylmuramate dehydrogenase [Clostridia bacterium]
MDRLKRFLSDNNVYYNENKKASEFTTFRIGGECFAVYPKDEAELIKTVSFCKEFGIKYIVLGCGSNVLFSDKGYNGAVIMTQSLNAVEVNDGVIKAGCGATLISVCKAALDNGLSGIEFAYGIPGSVGGAVFMNAGAYGGEMKDIVIKVKAYSASDGKIVEFNTEKCGFGYRESVFSGGGYIILSAEMKLTRVEKTEIKAVMDDLLGRRKSKQPLNYPSAGSVFKRYPGRYTGQMIEEAGLKGYTIGGAQVSEKHAGFIINVGGATADDVIKLIDHIKEVIKDREGIDIETEVRVIE